MSRYDVLHACYLSGQIDEREMADMVRHDEVLAAYLKRKERKDARTASR